MCKRIRLAGNGNFNVDFCKCGAIHLTVGFTTIRLDPGAYRKLASVLDDGIRSLEASALDNPTLH